MSSRDQVVSDRRELSDYDSRELRALVHPVIAVFQTEWGPDPSGTGVWGRRGTGGRGPPCSYSPKEFATEEAKKEYEERLDRLDQERAARVQVLKTCALVRQDSDCSGMQDELLSPLFDPNYKTDVLSVFLLPIGYIALLVAIANNNHSVVQYLLNYLKTNLLPFESHSFDALTIAVFYAFEGLLKLLVDHTPLGFCSPPASHLLLETAIAQRNVEMVKWVTHLPFFEPKHMQRSAQMAAWFGIESHDVLKAFIESPAFSDTLVTTILVEVFQRGRWALPIASELLRFPIISKAISSRPKELKRTIMTSIRHPPFCSFERCSELDQIVETRFSELTPTTLKPGSSFSSSIQRPSKRSRFT